MKTQPVCRFLLAVLLFAIGSTLFAHGQTLTMLLSFTGKNGEGESPLAPLVFDNTGAAYGSTPIGGTGQYGTVFKLTPPTGSGSWKQNVLFTFSGGSIGQQPNDISLGTNGVIYSTTFLGGSDNCYQGCGTIFSLTPLAGKGTYTFSTLYEFLGGEDGQAPGNIKLGANGILYGVTPTTIYQFSPPAEAGGDWTKTILYNFPSSKNDGVGANADIVLDSKGNIYGTTYEGGSSNYGIVFEISPPAEPGGPWTETILHSFTGTTDGGYPIGGLTIGGDGVIYGTASYSGVANDSGTAFSLTPPSGSVGAWTYTVLHTFSGGKDAATPATTMALDSRGNLYGTSWNGGSSACYLGCGTIFELSPTTSGSAWQETILHDWANSGQAPNASIVVWHNPLLYGTSEFLGADNDGSVFTLTP